MEDIKKLIRNYYKSIDAESLYLPSQSSFRHFRFLTLRGMVKIKDRITNKKKLKQQLIKLAPISVYYGISLWGNPSIIGKRTKNIYNNHFLGCDYIIDIDSKDFNEAKKEAQRIVKFLKLEYFSFKVRSSGSGVHIVIPCVYIGINEKNALETLERFTKRLISREFEYDYETSTDTRRIIKLPNTISSNGNLCEEISLEDLKNYQPKKVLPNLKIKNIKIKELIGELDGYS